VPLGDRAFEIVEVLVGSSGELITKNDLIDRVWPGAIVEESTLYVHLSAIRKAFGADRGMLKTAKGRGYRLLGSWEIQHEKALPGAADPEQESVPERSFRENLLPASELIGRESAILHVRDLLSAYRAVTLTGPGGIGKTALALEVARGMFLALDGDALIVELASLAQGSLVPSSVASVLGLDMRGDVITSQSVARAIGRKRLLLILDNCEHVVEAAAELVNTLVRCCPRTTVLATSREVLRIDGERVYRVSTLEVPSQKQEEAGDILESPAVQLFIARTKALRSDFPLHGENLSAIASICRRLDGIPLAIEFAAARAAALGARQVASRLDDRFGLLAGLRTVLARHRTLRAALDWSYDLLPELERRLLYRVAIFPAGFTLEAALAVMRDTSAAEADVLEGIANLVGKSLVVLDGTTAARRWRLLETIRAYALEKLASSGDAGSTARHHAEFFRDLIPQSAASLQSQPTVEEMDRYAREIDNVRAALDWSFCPDGVPVIGAFLTAAYVPVWMHLSLVIECRDCVERALDQIEADESLGASVRLRLHLGLGFTLVFTMGSVEKARAVLTKALESAERLSDTDAEVRALRMLGALHLYTGECRAARSVAERLSSTARRCNDPTVVYIADRVLGNVLQYAGEQPEAQRCLQRTLEFYFEQKGQRLTEWFRFDHRLMARAMLAKVLWLRGYVDQAVEQARVSLEEGKSTDTRVTFFWVLHHAVCPVAILTGNFVAAQQAVSTIVDVANSLNGTLWIMLARCLDGKLLIERGEILLGSSLLRTTLDTFEKTGWAVCYPEYLGTLAHGLAELGQVADASTIVDKALAMAKRGGELSYAPELLRIKGDLLIRRARYQPISEAEDCLHEAIEVARQQGALSWELRAALSLTRLRMRQNHIEAARKTLAAVYERFTEGFETADLRSAREVLEALTSR
jgi:predicted ATPase/DNA-binding winged helix-turn-helix (wHTH) protein